jgi:tetrahydromethanopterin S-methyltransferase subunit C
VARAYGLGQGVPTSFFIDGGGVVRAVALGAMDTATIAKNLSTVTQ